ncbi:MAG: DNA polymerase IV [Bacteroidota bacterium]|nr:DNA polymerase IV [Bacteroidota bacterium]
MDRTIVHMDLDTFFVSVERLMDSRLQSKPVLVGGTTERGVVSSCSYETRKMGVRSGMSMKMAKQLCPEAIVVRGDSSKYSYYSKIISEMVKEQVPLFEKTSIDEFYIDLSGMDHFFGSYKLASEIRSKIIKETSLPISFGMSINKTVAKMATGEAKPNNQIDVQKGLEKSFIAPMPIEKIPMVGEKTAYKLNQMGVKYIKTLQEIPLKMMENAFGKHGVLMWQKANAIDNSPVVPYHERKSISTERTFEQDTIDVQMIKNHLGAMVEQLCFELRRGDKLTSCVMVKIRYADFQTYTKQKYIPYTASDHNLKKYVLDLFDKLFERRLLVRLIGVRMSHLVAGGHQINMFEDSVELLKLYRAMDKMKLRFGQQKIQKASHLGTMSLARDNPFNGDPPSIPAHRRA